MSHASNVQIGRSRSRREVLASLGVAICITAGAGVLTADAHAQSSPSTQAGSLVTTTARGTFDVTLTPQPAAPGDGGIGRMALDKQFHGDLAGTSQGAMLAAMTAVSGSAGYVAMERVTGTLDGRRGTFVLQHSGTMDRGTQQLSLTVVPDSGTDQLAGLAGTMTITIAGGVHSYALDYTIAASD